MEDVFLLRHSVTRKNEFQALTTTSSQSFRSESIHVCIKSPFKNPKPSRTFYEDLLTGSDLFHHKRASFTKCYPAIVTWTVHRIILERSSYFCLEIVKAAFTERHTITDCGYQLFFNTGTQFVFPMLRNMLAGIRSFFL